jgi:hypothetical protein
MGATFDLHRPLLYQALRQELPNNPSEERRLGKQLTEYLWEGRSNSKDRPPRPPYHRRCDRGDDAIAAAGWGDRALTMGVFGPVKD